MNSGTTAPPEAGGSGEVLHPSYRDRWGPTLAAIITAVHCVTGMLVLSWYAFAVPHLKAEVEGVGSAIPQNAVLLILQSDLLVNYWYLWLIFGLFAVKYDFLIMRWGMRQSGLKWGLSAGGCIATILLFTVVCGQVVIHQARSFLSASKALATVRNAVPKIGDRVFLKTDAEAMIDETKVDIKTISFPATIVEIKADKVLLRKALDPKNDVRAWVRKSDVMMEDEALDYYSKQIQKEPTNPRFWLCRGLIWREKGKPKDAINDLSEAIILDPQFTEAYKQRGITCRGWGIKGDLNTSFNDFSEVVRLAPNDPSGYSWRAYGWDERGDIDNSINDYTMAISLDPKDAITHNFRGYYWGLKGEFENADKDFSEALRLDQTDADIHNSIAWLRATCPDERYRDGKEAVEHATKACDLTPFKRPGFFDTLAAAYAEIGDFTNAIKWQEKAIELRGGKKTQEMNECLELYRSNRPYRKSPKK